MKTYRYGQRLFTADEIREIAMRHGHDGIEYYPPSYWGTNHTPRSLLLFATEADGIYAEAFHRGANMRKTTRMGSMR